MPPNCARDAPAQREKASSARAGRRRDTAKKDDEHFEADFDGAALAEAWRAHRREGLRHLVVTGRDGATLGTYAGDGAGDAAPPAQLVAAIVSQAQKMRLGNLESLVALYDRCLCLVVLDRAALRGDGRRGAGRGRGRYFGAAAPRSRRRCGGRA